MSLSVLLVIMRCGIRAIRAGTDTLGSPSPSPKVSALFFYLYWSGWQPHNTRLTETNEHCSLIHYVLFGVWGIFFRLLFCYFLIGWHANACVILSRPCKTDAKIYVRHFFYRMPRDLSMEPRVVICFISPVFFFFWFAVDGIFGSALCLACCTHI